MAEGNYRLAVWPFLRGLGYTLLGEIIVLWILIYPGGGDSRAARVIRAFLGLWWIWLGLTAALGLALLFGTRLRLDGRGISRATFGRAWHGFSWEDAAEVRVLVVGETLVLLARAGGGFRFWRQSGLDDAEGLGREIERQLEGRLAPDLTPPYRARKGFTWKVNGKIEGRLRRREVSFLPDELEGLRFVFLEGDDLPMKVFIFPNDLEQRVEAAGREISYFPFLAVDLLRWARKNGLKVVCTDFGRKKRKTRTGPIPVRAWERLE